MQAHNVLRLVEACAPGARVKVIVRGASYDLPRTPDPEPVVPPHPLEDVSRQLLERDASTRATVESVVANVVDVVARVDQAVEQVRQAVGTVAEGQDQIAKGVGRMAATLAMPVVPVVDTHGKLIGAKRVPRLGD